MRFQTANIPLLPKENTANLDSADKFQNLPEGDLWELFRQGDPQAFHHIYIKYFPVLFHYGHQFTKDTELVKDVIQDLFIYLKEKRSTLGKTTSIKFYLFKAFRRRINRYIKKNDHWERMHTELKGFEIALSQESTLINATLDEELRQKLEQAFKTLTQRQREIILYYFYENFSYKEITSIMGFSKVQYARILVNRSISKLREELRNLKIF